MKNTFDRFVEKFVVNDDTGCWDWIASTNNGGYGTFYNGYGITVGAHRWSFEYYRQKIADAMTIDHLCKNRKCVNPDHMEVVTLKENVLRSNSPSATNARKQYCPEGHPLFGDNLRVNSFNARTCKTCHRRNDRKSYYKRTEGKSERRVHPKRWTKQEKKIVIDNYSTMNDQDLLNILPGRTWNAIVRTANRNGVVRRNGDNFGPAQ